MLQTDVSTRKSFQLPPLTPHPTSTKPRFPGEWNEADQDHIYANVLAAMEDYTEIVLPETWQELVDLATKRSAPHVKAFNPAQQAAWNRVVEAWDSDVDTLPLIKGNIIMRSQDGKIVLVKLDQGLVIPWPEKEGKQIMRKLRAICRVRFNADSSFLRALQRLFREAPRWLDATCTCPGKV